MGEDGMSKQEWLNIFSCKELQNVFNTLILNQDLLINISKPHFGFLRQVKLFIDSTYFAA